MKIKLEAKNDAEQILLEYLEKNATETLVEKINNGVYIEKDGKRLLNKKSLQESLNYCCQEAKKMAEKGAVSLAVKDETVFGWCMHFFEEDSLEGTLYNEDGTVFKVAPKPVATVATPTPVVKPKKNDGQQSIFDLLEQEQPDDTDAGEDDNDEPVSVTDITPIVANVAKPENTTVEEIATKLETAVNEKYAQKQNTPNAIYQKYLTVQGQHPNAIVFMRLGDFYELFADSATTIADELDLTLTSKNVGLPERVAMAGVPYHASDKYFDKAREKHEVVIIETDGNVTVLPVKTAVPDVKHWISANTYADGNGELHEEQRPVPAFLRAMFGNEIVMG